MPFSLSQEVARIDLVVSRGKHGDVPPAVSAASKIAMMACSLARSGGSSSLRSRISTHTRPSGLFSWASWRQSSRPLCRAASR